MLDKSFIEKIESLSDQANCKIIVDGAGKQYTAINLKRLYDDPRPAAVKVRSLTGIVDYLKDNKDGLNMADLTIIIVDQETVQVVTKVQGESNERHTVIQADLESIQSFPYERFIEHETFLIKLRSLFAENTDRNTLLNFASKVSNDTSFGLEDDGVSQKVEVKRGLSGALKDEATAPSIVKLKPYRTFAECNQPESEFLFRMKDSQGVVCTLFEADGGFWKQKAREEIKGFFEENIPEISVLS